VSSYGRRIGIWSLDEYSGIARTMNLVVSPPSSGGRQTLLPDSKTGTAVMLASNPFAAASAANNHLLCWHRSTGQSTPVEHSFRGIVTALAWNRDHSAVLLATKSPSAIRRLPVDNGCPVGPGSVLATVAAKNAAITAVAPLADSTLLALVPGQGLYRFGLNGHVIQTWGGGGPEERQVLSFAVSPDGRSILMGHDGGLVEQYALETGHVVHEWSEPDGTGKVGSVTFLSYGLVAASKGEGNVYLINGSNGEVVKQLGGAQGFVLSSAGKGALLIGTEPGYQLAVWDMPTGLLMTRFTYSHSVEPLTGPTRRASMLTSVVEDEDGNTWFGAAGAYVARWDLDPYRWNGTACTLLHGLPAPNFVQPSAISQACSG
jgi:WD40 repeat protein